MLCVRSPSWQAFISSLKQKDFVSFRNKMVENSEVHVVKVVQRGQNEGPEADGSLRICSQCSGDSTVDTGTWNRTTDLD